MSDILSIHIPAVVLLRDIIDHEQELHLKRLASLTGTSLKVIPEKKASPESLQHALASQLHATVNEGERPDMNGAENAARKLMEYIESV